MEKKGIYILEKTESPISLTQVVEAFQEVAGGHAHLHRMGPKDLLPLQKAWVLYRLRVAWANRPLKDEACRLETWVQDMRRSFSRRNYRLLSKSGSLLASGAALWMLMDLDSRRPARVGSHDFPLHPDRGAPCGPPEKLIPAGRALHTFDHLVGKEDTDQLGHVNNVRYIQLIEDFIRRIQPGFIASALDINYLAEAHPGDHLKVRLAPAAEGWELSIETAGGDPAVLARIQK